MLNRIVFVISSLKAGGAERVATTLANGLSSKYEVIIVVIGKNANFYPVSNCVKVIELDLQYNTHSIFEAIGANLKRINAIYSQLKQLKPSVCISFLTHTNIMVIPLCRWLKIPIIATEHGIYSGLKERLWRFLRRITYPFANQVSVLTFADAKNYPFVKHLIVLPNPIDKPTNPQNNINLSCDTPFFFSAGRLIKSKQFDKLLKAFSVFLNTSYAKEYHLKIAGNGAELETLKSLAKELKIDNRVEFLGQIKDLAPYYTQAKCFVLASKQEGFGNVLVESLLCGTPVISFDCPYGPSEIINKDNGILVSINDVEGFAKAMSEIVSNDSLYQHFKQNATISVEKFTTQAVLKEWEAIILNYLS